MVAWYIKMVYEPAEDSFLLRKHIAEYARGDVLDMGTGSGILAIEAKRYADNVLAADIDTDALANAAEKGIDTIQSDLFANIHRRFDLIIFNPPYLPDDEGIADPALYGGKEGYEVIERFLIQAKDHLKTIGRILLLFSSFSGKDKIDRLLDENHYRFRQIDHKHVFFEDLYVYIIEIGS